MSPRRHRQFLIPSLFGLVLTFSIACSHTSARDDGAEGRSCLLIVLDGLRPDYVRPDWMPHLYELSQRGVVGTNHHSVFPTVTRVNAASIATGSYPETHGLLGNSVYFPEVEPAKSLSTGDAKNLERIEVATGGKLLTATSIGEWLDQHGKRLLVGSSGSTGSAFLLNHKVKGVGIVHTERNWPESLAAATAELGPAPPETEPNAAQNKRAVNAYIRLGLRREKPDLTILWLSDPDHTAHEKGIGDPVTVESLTLVDHEIGRIVQTHKDLGLEKSVNIIVTSDHGFSTHLGGMDLGRLLVQNQLKASMQSDDVVISDGAIYVKDHDAEKIRKIVELLQKTERIGAIFTKRALPTHPEGIVPGTLSFTLAHWDHERAADILVSADWNDAENSHGFKGAAFQSGVAGHGTSSPWDIHNTLIAFGPDFKSKTQIKTPTSNADLAPTICKLLGISPAPTMTGRIIEELLDDGPDARDIKILEREYRSEAHGKNAGYKVEANESSVNGVDYLDWVKAERK